MAVPLRQCPDLTARVPVRSGLGGSGFSHRQDGGDLPGRTDELAVQRRSQMGVADDPDGVSAALHPAGQQRVVRQDGPHTRHNGGIAVAVPVDLLSGFLPGDPLGSSGAGGNFAVQGHSVFHHHIGPLRANVVEKDIIKGVTFRLQNPDLHLHAVGTQKCQALARHKRVGVPGTYHHTSDARFQYGVRSWSPPTKKCLEQTVQGTVMRQSVPRPRKNKKPRNDTHSRATPWAQV